MSQPRLTYDAFARIAPVARQSLIAMGRQADDSGIDKQIIELVKLRVSQFNNCAFCLQIHLNVARKLGVPQEKLDLVATWEEAGIFPEQERAGAYLGGDADAPRRPQRLERSLPSGAPALQQGGSRLPLGLDRHDRCLEPAGSRVPLCPTDSEDDGGGGVN
jgi:AhpD family alkylhydroperoxidase